MTQIFLALLEHPLTFAFLVICLLVFIGMTYGFILHLFGKKGIGNPLNEHWVGTINDAPPPPPEPAKVPNPPLPPNDTLKAEEDLPCTDDEEDYVYRDGNLGISSWTTNYRDVDEVKNEKEKEGVH